MTSVDTPVMPDGVDMWTVPRSAGTIMKPNKYGDLIYIERKDSLWALWAAQSLPKVTAERDRQREQALDYYVKLTAAEAEVSALSARVKALEQALEPFADAAECIDEPDKDRWNAWEHPAAMAVTLGDFRKARALIGKEPS